jgi:malonyl CoA-acyl carrier protein transacylase
MIELGIESYTEVGPGKVLQGLNKRINRDLVTKGVESMEQVENFYV